MVEQRGMLVAYEQSVALHIVECNRAEKKSIH
jgi:hypothetical protein